MKFRTLTRHAREGFRNIGRNGWMSFASVSSVAITLFVLGLFLVLAMNVNHSADVVEKQVEVRAYLKADTTHEQVGQVQEEIEQLATVESVNFITKEQGLETFRESWGDKGNLLTGLEGEENPLLDAFAVKPKNPQETSTIAETLTELPHIENVVFGEETIEKLFSVTKVVRNIGMVLIIALAFTAMFLIANTIKLTIVARRREIEIMKLVGATNAFIRWPFFIEGLLMGVVGAIIPIAILLTGYYYVIKFVKVDLNLYFLQLLPLDPLAWQITLLLMGIGAFIGVWGSMVSVRRFLKI
ncbi:cell division protein FtsX [Ammoniphilus oxalaticus]|uniref:Cell division protein FtsX n=1 Tax=Ammoniphilus oxalaticus TaxID=66863 RepID=A0A419SET3_9BACL|nr:permease-like cell division protein FtsX [Ammoniphilus oxalaticus]RKD21823.1 cell division protein FtsX [Ammoniphilus oxalaticus]